MGRQEACSQCSEYLIYLSRASPCNFRVWNWLRLIFPAFRLPTFFCPPPPVIHTFSHLCLLLKLLPCWGHTDDFFSFFCFMWQLGVDSDRNVMHHYLLCFVSGKRTGLFSQTDQPKLIRHTIKSTVSQCPPPALVPQAMSQLVLIYEIYYSIHLYILNVSNVFWFSMQ